MLTTRVCLLPLFMGLLLHQNLSTIFLFIYLFIVNKQYNNRTKFIRSLSTDGYGSETYWEVIAEDGTILGSGGSYASNTTIPTENVLVPGNQCFEFILYDSYGDGMCCANGVGSVLVQDASGNIIFDGNSTNLQNFNEISTAFSTGVVRKSRFSTGFSTGFYWILMKILMDSHGF